MIRRYIVAFALVLLGFLPVSSVWAQQNVRFTDLPLTLTPEEMIRSLEAKGMHLVMGTGIPNTYRLTAQIAGLFVTLDINCSRDTMHIEQMHLSTQPAKRSLHDDYKAMMHWMQTHYGAPDWESFVRSHPFARWYVGFDRDIVLIATAKSTIEVWFYNNHHQRHFDYYAILKYCEQHPVDSAPHLTARESVTWRSATPPTAKKKSSKRHLRKKTSKRKTKRGNRAKHRRQRRSR